MNGIELDLAPSSLAFLWLGMELLTKVTIVLIVAAGAAMLLKRASAASRHLVWAIALSSIIAIPFLVFSLPSSDRRTS